MAAAKKKTAPKTAAAPKKKAAAPKTPAAAKKVAAPAKKAAPGKKAAAPKKMAGPRADFGASIDSFFARPDLPLRDVLVEVRALVEQTVPDAVPALKWGQPFYTLEGQMLCGVAGHKAHVNLIFAGPPGTFADPGGLLAGEGQTGRRLTLRSVDDLPVAAVKGWLKAAATLARANGAKPKAKK